MLMAGVPLQFPDPPPVVVVDVAPSSCGAGATLSSTKMALLTSPVLKGFEEEVRWPSEPEAAVAFVIVCASPCAPCAFTSIHGLGPVMRRF